MAIILINYYPFNHLFAIINKIISTSREKTVFSVIASFFDVASCISKRNCFNFSNSLAPLRFIQKQPSINVLIKRCSENIYQMYRRIAKQILLTVCSYHVTYAFHSQTHSLLHTTTHFLFVTLSQFLCDFYINCK